MHLRSVVPVYVAYALLLVASCAGAEDLPSQPTPVALVTSLQNCPTTSDPDQLQSTSSCATLAPNSTVALQPGPPATLPLHTTLVGGPLTASCCDISTPDSPSPPQHTNATTNNSTTTSLPQLDLSRLAPSSLVVPPNGTLSLHNLALAAAQLPTAPYPLPSTSFLSLLAIRLSPGARLQLSSVTITTPSCVSLALHQDLACRVAPTPNFTVTPTSLLVHSYTAASVSAQDVLLTCGGRQLPAPCSATVVRSGVEVLRAAWAWEQARDSLPVPLYLYVEGTIQLSWLVAQARSSGEGEAGNEAPSDMSVWEEVQNLHPESTALPITRGILVLGGPPDRSSVLELAGSALLWGVQDAGSLRLQHLTLRGLPTGPPERYPEALVRLPMWFAPVLLSWVGSRKEPLLFVTNVTVELPSEEVAFWRAARSLDLQRLVPVEVVEASLDGGPDDDSAEACITDSGTVFSVQELASVPGCSSCVLAVELTNMGRALVIRNALLVPPPLLSQQQLGSAGASNTQQSQQGRAEQQQAQDLDGGLRLPPAPFTPLCALAPGPGAQEAELFHQLLVKTYLDAAFGRPTSAPPSHAPYPPTLPPSSGRQGHLPPPLLRHLFPTGVDGYLYPNDLSHTFVIIGNPTFATVLAKDARVDIRNRHSDLYNFLRGQAVVNLPGTLLLGDPVGIRTLDLAGFPSAVVLEREPLDNAPSDWSKQEALVLLPLLETVRQQRQAAGLRGLLTEPVSLTVRHLVLVNLPAAGPFVRILPPPGPPRQPVWQPQEEGSRRLLLVEIADTNGAMDVRVASRGLRQAPQPSAVGDESVMGAGAAGAGAAGAGAVAASADYLGGLHPSLANLTSCVWSLQLDRAAVVLAVRVRLQQGGTGGGNSSSSSGGGVQSPVDVPYVLLQSVQLVVPERELLLLAWAWATNATRHAAHPGLAEQLQLMLDGSRLAGGAEAALQQLLQDTTGPPPALPAGLRLVFDQFVWCGLLGANVTLTSQLPGPTPLSLQLPDLDLPVAYGTGTDDGDQGSTSPPWVRVPPVAVPQPSSGVVGGQRAPAAGRDGQPKDVDTGAAAPWSNNGSTQPPAAAAGGDGGGGGSSKPPLPLGAAVALAVGCTAVLVGAVAGVGIWLLRRRRGQAQAKTGGCELGGAQQLGQEGMGTAGGDTSAKLQEGSCVADAVRDAGVTEGSCVSTVTYAEQRKPRPPSAVLHQLVSMRLLMEHSRQVVLGQLEDQQQQRQLPAELPKQGKTHRLPGAGYGACELAAQRGASGGACMLGSSMRSSALRSEGDTGSGSPASVNSAGLGVAHVGSSGVAGDQGDSDLSLDLGAASASNFGTGEVLAAAAPSRGVGPAPAMANGNSKEQSCPHGRVGGGRRSSNRGSTNPLVLLRELSRGAQGVVYAGRWRGLDVAVKSMLVQRLGGSPTGATWHGPSLHSALAEGSISSAMSHPHVVATYATYVQGPEGEAQEMVREQDAQAREGDTASGAAGGPCMPPPGEAAVGQTQEAAVRVGGGTAGGPRLLAPGAFGATASIHRSATAAPALGMTRSEDAAELQKGHGGNGGVDGVAGAAIATGSSRGCNSLGGAAVGEQAQHPERHAADTTARQATTEHSGAAIPVQEAPCRSQPAQLRTSGAARAQVQVWKLTLVQELCTGGSLRDSLLAGRLARRGGGPWPRALHPAAALRLALHVARGSAHLHRHGVLWNDLSSANVLLQLGRQGGAGGEAAGADSTDSSGALDFVAKVADFGLSRRLPEGATHASETAGRSGLYVAPEVIRYGRCTPASDVYAYGVLLWEVAAGVPLPELLSQPEGGAVRSWLARQAFVPPEEAEALPAELLAWPGAEQRRGGGGPTMDGAVPGDGISGYGDGAGLLPAGYVALAGQCLRQDPRQRPSFEDVCGRLTHIELARPGS